MYKRIWKIVLAIAIQPARAWNMLLKHKDKEQSDTFLGQFVYPLIGLVTAASFLSVLLTYQRFDLELALKSAIRALVSSFGGFYLAAYLLNELWQAHWKQKKELKRWQWFVGYASSVMFALNIILPLVPDFFFLRLGILYTGYIVWEGAEPCWGIAEQLRLKFVAMATLIILGAPVLIDWILAFFMPKLIV